MLQLFYCHAPEDAALVAELEKHLAPLKKTSGLITWRASDLLAGAERDIEIARRLDEADVILLMLSIDLLSSLGSHDEQLQQALKRHDEGTARVIPIRLRDADYSQAPFVNLQALPKDGRSVKSHSDRDPVWTDVAFEIRLAMQTLSQLPPRPDASKSKRTSTEMDGGYSNRPAPPAHLPWLEARFRKSDSKWFVQLVPEAGISRERPLRIPARPEDTFMCLFDEDKDVDLMRHAWRLRLRAKELELDSEWPPIKSWTHLYHPDDDCHLLDRGWTITELTARPRRGDCSGTVAAIAGSTLLRTLRKLLGPRVQSASVEGIPHRSLLVVQGVTDLHEISAIQGAALRAECPLVVWADPQEIPRSHLSEVLVTKETKEPLGSWLVRFLSRLLSGIDPERSFAYAGLGGPPEDRVARWLRGAFSAWHVDPPDNAVALDPRWFVRLDRSRQESELNRLVHHLLLPNTKRRVQVIVTMGPEGSGLELFSHRPPLISPELPFTPVVEWDLTWTENPGNQEQRLMQRLGARRSVDLSERLLMEAIRLHEQHTGTKGSRVLFWGRHDVACLTVGHDLRQVTHEDLELYFAALTDLALQLSRTDIRVLFSLPFRESTREPLANLECDERYFKVSVLPALPSGVPADELRSWLSDAGLPYDDRTIEHMLMLSYDALVQWLVDRYPELRSL